MMSMLIMIVNELGCAYRWSKQYKQLEWAPMYVNNIIDEEQWGTVEEEVVGEEEVVYQGRRVTLSDVYRDVEFKLGVK